MPARISEKAKVAHEKKPRLIEDSAVSTSELSSALVKKKELSSAREGVEKNFLLLEREWKRGKRRKNIEGTKALTLHLLGWVRSSSLSPVPTHFHL